MNSKLILCLASAMSGGLCGCSTMRCPMVDAQKDAWPLYLYWGSMDGSSAGRFLSARIHPGEAIHVGGDDFMELTGHIEVQGTNIHADVMGNTGQQAQFYRGDVTFQKPFFAQGGAASGGAGGANWFVISTNGDCRTVLENVNAVMGLTGAPFYHPAVPDHPASRPAAPPVDPSTSPPVQTDPSTGLPILRKHDLNP